MQIKDISHIPIGFCLYPKFFKFCINSHRAALTFFPQQGSVDGDGSGGDSGGDWQLKSSLQLSELNGLPEVKGPLLGVAINTTPTRNGKIDAPAAISVAAADASGESEAAGILDSEAAALPA